MFKLCIVMSPVSAMRFVFLSIYLLHHVESRVFYVDQHQELAGDGSWTHPFEKIADCVKQLSQPGDQCQIRAGVYHENIEITGLHGDADNPIVITGYNNERPVLDGMVEISPLGGEWNRSGEIYYGEISETIWQLFLGDQMMTNARWPNAKWSDKSLFNGHIWAGLAPGSEPGRIVNKGDSLKDTGLNMTDAVAVLNVGKWNTFVAKVGHHDPDKNFFTYDDTFGDYTITTDLSRYFLEDKLELLDAPEEWFFDKSSRVLSFIPPGDVDMSTAKLRGKVQSYAMTIADSSNVLFKNLDFFGTTLRAVSSGKEEHVDHLTFHSLNFNYPSYSKRMLGEIGLIEKTDIDGIYNRRDKSSWGSFTFFNNTFYGSDGIALAYHGRNNTVENNLFEFNDWTSANMLKYGGGMATIWSDSIWDSMTRNTLHYNGNGCGIRPGFVSSVTLNHISHQCWGFQQNDGAGIQLATRIQKDAHIDYNWIHDSPKWGIRFDGEPPRVGVNGSVTNNVVYRTNGIVTKGDYHETSNNLVYEKENGVKPDSEECSLCVWRTVRQNPVQINQHSTALNNIADAANGGAMWKNGKKVRVDGVVQLWPIAGAHVDNNLATENIRDILYDIDNQDFRPRGKKEAAAKGVGPYSVITARSEYWIPGRKLYKTSSPVPPNDSVTVAAGRRNALMWLNAYGCSIHMVYFGQNKTTVSTADEESPEFLGSVSSEVNVKFLRRSGIKVQAGEWYFWRVDAVTEDREVVKGDVWQFKAI